VIEAVRISFWSFFERARSALLTRTGKHTALVFFGQVINAGIGFSLNILLLRKLGVGEYGIFSLFNSSLMLLAGFFHMGWIETYVRFGAKHLEAPLFLSLRWLIFRRFVIASAILTVLGILLSSWAADRFYHRADFSNGLRLAVLGAFATGLFSFILNDCRVRGNFWNFFKVQTGSTLLRFMVCAGALAAGVLNLSWVIGSYSLVPLVFGVSGLFWPKTGICWERGNEKIDPPIVREMSVYNRWLLVSLFTTNLIGNVDSQIIAHYQDNLALSMYGAVGRLTLPISFLVTAISTTLLPRLSSAKSSWEVRFYLSRLKLFLIPLSILVLICAVAAPPLLIRLAGPSYDSIGPMLRIQILCNLIVLVTNPLGLVIYAWGWSWLFAYLNLAQLAVDLALCFWWIPKAGPMGAIWTNVVVNLLGLAFVTCALIVGMRKNHFNEVFNEVAEPEGGGR
jgi:O-antigen/teichoic acid export membrane protein